TRYSVQDDGYKAWTRLTKQQSKIFLAFCYYVPLQQNVVIKELSNCKNSFSDKGDELFCHQ
ncbi:hypothetical protein AAA215_19590, partial [Phocaeicola vulgatus]